MPPWRSARALVEHAVLVRRANDGDAQVLWEWANDPETRAQSFSQEPIPWDDHVRWLDERLLDPATTFYIATTPTGDAIGQIRLDRRASGDAEISLTVGPRWRGRGYASAVLREACRVYREETRIPIVAYIKPDNEPSLRSFAGAGFERMGTATALGELVVEMILREPNEP